MKSAISLFSLALCASSLLTLDLSAQKGVAPSLAIHVGTTAVTLDVSGPPAPFVGAVILSLSPDLTHYLVDLPPLLSDFAVLGVGIGDKSYTASIPKVNVPPGLFLYAQGVVLGDAILATDVGSFVLDAKGSGQR